MNQMPDKILGGYVPVIHQGYIDVFRQHPDRQVALFDDSITSRFDYLRKDIRKLETSMVIDALGGLGVRAISMSFEDFSSRLSREKEDILLFDDDVSHSLAAQIPGARATVQYVSPFLRWDRDNVNKEFAVQPDRTVQADGFIVEQLADELQRSTDWWRHVSAGMVTEGKFITTHNHAQPHDYVNFIDGDPRITGGQGKGIDKSVFIHAEADLIATLAKKGIPTQNESIYVTTFPCPNCAKLITAAGFKACYYVDGYGMLDGERILRDMDVELVKIETDVPLAVDTSRLRPYPEKATD